MLSLLLMRMGMLSAPIKEYDIIVMYSKIEKFHARTT